MNNCSNKNILNSIYKTIHDFRVNQISIDNMLANLSGNISALEGVDSKFIDNFQGVIGEVEFIKYTENSDLVHELVLKEINDYENYLKEYFSNIK